MSVPMIPRKAFTLIELLVVIAIIAILAAILFPVFAQAKRAAKKTVALSQAKQIGTGLQIYLADADDTMPQVSSGGPNSVDRIDYWVNLLPYVKNSDIFFSSERTETGCQLNGSDPTIAAMEKGFNPKFRCLGYGYNWGPQIYAGGGMLQAEQRLADGGSVQPGISATSIEESANTFVLGDTYDTPRYTMGMFPNSAGGKAWILDTFNVTAGTKQGDFRWSGKLQMVYADSHAKQVQFRGGLTNSVGYVYAPAAPRDRVAYCAQPSAILDGSKFGAGQIACQDFVMLPEKNGTTWSPN